MSGDKALERGRVRGIRTAFGGCLEERKELLACRDREELESIEDDVHFGPVRKPEFDRQAVRVRLRRAVRKVGYAGRIREPRYYWHRWSLEEDRLADLIGFGGWREAPFDDRSLRVVRSDPGMPAE